MASIPRVSVVMPAYNAEPFVGSALESVLAQTFHDFELIVVDDFSTDDTRSIVESYAAKDHRIRLLNNVLAKGVAGAINTGLQDALGEYLARADADDINRPYRLAKQVAFLDLHPEISILGGGYAPFSSHGQKPSMIHPASSLEIAWRFLSNTFFCHPSVIFRRTVYDRLGGYPYVEAEDFAFFSDVLHHYRGANLPEVLIDYRESPGNRSFSAAEQLRASVKKQYLNNFLFYGGDEKTAEAFFAYQEEHRVPSWCALPRLFTLDFRICGQIRRQYGMRWRDGEHLRFWRDRFRGYATMLRWR